MTKFKKVFTSILVAFCLIVTPVFQVYASNPNDEIMPIMEYISNFDYGFSINNCNANIDVTLDAIPSATHCEVNIKLEEKGLIFWHEKESWTFENFSNSLDCAQTSNVTDGKKYRIEITATVWVGSESETRTKTSNTITA